MKKYNVILYSMYKGHYIGVKVKEFNEIDKAIEYMNEMNEHIARFHQDTKEKRAYQIKEETC